MSDGGCGGGGPTTYLNRLQGNIDKINEYLGELDSTVFYDSKYTVQKVKDKATEAMNQMTEVKVKIENKYNSL